MYIAQYQKFVKKTLNWENAILQNNITILLKYLINLFIICTTTTPRCNHLQLTQINSCIIQQGKLAKELDFVSHHVRTKLDELKRQEVNRLRTLIKAKQDLEGGNGMLCNTMYILLLFKCYSFNMTLHVNKKKIL